MGARRAAQAAALLAAGFWVLVTIGGTANPGYRQYEEYVSSLAAHGAQQPWWGIAAMLCLAGSLLIVGPALAPWDRLVSRAVLAGGSALLLATGLRMGCPPRARFCTRSDTDWFTDLLHASAVLVAAAALLFGLFAAAIHLWRGSPRVRDAVPAALGAAVVLAVVGYPLLTLTGLQQRLVILLVQVAIVAAAAAAAGEARRVERQRARAAAHERSLGSPR